MEIQSRFSGDSKAPYSGICCQSCWTARKEKCVCKCGGVYHGLGTARDSNADELPNTVYMKPDVADMIRAKLTSPSCKWCATSLQKEEVRGYPHGAGWKVKGHSDLLWLYIRCPKCNYDWAIWKLGVPREEEFS